MKTSDNIDKEQLRCLEAVQRLNNEMHNKEGRSEHTTLLSMTIYSYMHFVTVNLNNCNTEIELFNSSNNDRIYYEKSDKYEQWYSFLKRKFREIKSEINQIKL